MIQSFKHNVTASYCTTKRNIVSAEVFYEDTQMFSFGFIMRKPVCNSSSCLPNWMTAEEHIELLKATAEVYENFLNNTLPVGDINESK